MLLFARLRRVLALADHLPALEQRLEVLEQQQHPTKLLEWLELTERLQRYLSRISAVEQRLDAKRKDDSSSSSSAADPVTIALLRSKYPHANGG